MSTGRVILVIEDDHEVRAFLGDVLRDEGYQVLLAESGEAALEHLTTVQPDLITTDLNLPGIGGGQLIQALRQQPVDSAGSRDISTARVDRRAGTEVSYACKR